MRLSALRVVMAQEAASKAFVRFNQLLFRDSASITGALFCVFLLLFGHRHRNFLPAMPHEFVGASLSWGMRVCVIVCVSVRVSVSVP